MKTTTKTIPYVHGEPMVDVLSRAGLVPETCSWKSTREEPYRIIVEGTSARTLKKVHMILRLAPGKTIK